MNIKIFCVCMVLFSTGVSAQAIANPSGLSFGDQVVGVPATPIIAPTAAGAAVFNVTGMIPGRTVTCRLISNSVNITNGGSGGNNRIAISAFTINGCTAVVPAGGAINNIGVGATATITTAKLEGSYSGTNTFRITTN
jgi:hypothetical protein